MNIMWVWEHPTVFSQSHCSVPALWPCTRAPVLCSTAWQWCFSRKGGQVCHIFQDTTEKDFFLLILFYGKSILIQDQRGHTDTCVTLLYFNVMNTCIGETK